MHIHLYIHCTKGHSGYTFICIFPVLIFVRHTRHPVSNFIAQGRHGLMQGLLSPSEGEFGRIVRGRSHGKAFPSDFAHGIFTVVLTAFSP